MKVAVTFTKKVPTPEEYSSQGYHLTIETEPPREVAQDREKLRGYVEQMFAECRARVDDQVARGRPARAEARPAPVRNTTRRPPGTVRRAFRLSPLAVPQPEPWLARPRAADAARHLEIINAEPAHPPAAAARLHRSGRL